MPILLNLLILANAAAAATAPAAANSPAATTRAADQRDSDAVEVFRCDFGPQWDINFDRWPDRWTRACRRPAYPPYLPVRITDEASPEKHHPLRIDLDGGAAAVFGPSFKVSAIFSYVVEANVKTEGLVHWRRRLSFDHV